MEQPPYILRLFVTDITPELQRAIEALERLCRDSLQDTYRLEVIDVRENPQAAEEERILATPTLIKKLPPPLRRVIGDLSDENKVLLGLAIERGETEQPTL